MSTAINIHYRVDVTGLFHGLWWCTSASVTHFYMIRVSAMSYSISQVMTKLTLTLRRMFLRSDDEHTLLEENDNELLYKTLKCIGDAYDNLCNCCSTLNGDFGFSVLIILSAAFLYNLAVVYMISRYLMFSQIIYGLMNVLLLGITFYAITMMAISFESGQRAARGLCRSLALLNSELQRGDTSLRVLTRDVLHAVRARQPRLSACGLFELRMSLLTGLLSLTATYSIVLLQFTHFL